MDEKTNITMMNMELRRSMRRSGKNVSLPHQPDQIYADNLALRETMKAEIKNKGKRESTHTTQLQIEYGGAFSVRKRTQLTYEQQQSFPTVIRIPVQQTPPPHPTNVSTMPIRKSTKITDIIKRLNRRVLG